MGKLPMKKRRHVGAMKALPMKAMKASPAMKKNKRVLESAFAGAVRLRKMPASKCANIKKKAFFQHFIMEIKPNLYKE